MSSAPVEVPHRGELERRFGADFTSVRAYLGESDAMTELGAEAAAEGEVVAFRDGSPPLAIVAHELTHVVQQRRAGSAMPAGSKEAGSGDSEAEAEAGHNALRANAGLELSANAAPTASLQLDRGTAKAGAEAGSLDPGVETGLLELLRQPISAVDARAIQTRVRQLLAIVQAIPTDPRKRLLARIATAAPGDELAAAFHTRLHDATMRRVLVALRGEPVPLPLPHDAMTAEAFVARLPPDPLLIAPDPLVIHPRFSPEVTASVTMRSEFGPPIDEPAVTLVARLHDAESLEGGAERASWPGARETSQPAMFTLNRGGAYQLRLELVQGGLVVARRERAVTVVEPQTDLEAATKLSGEQRQAAHARMGSALAVVNPAADRKQLAADRNLLEFAGKQRGEPIAVDGRQYAEGPARVRAWIERAFLEGGMAAVDAFWSGLELEPEVRRQRELFKEDVKAFERSFGSAADAMVRTMLRESKATAEAELARYGIAVDTREIISRDDVYGLLPFDLTETTVTGGDNAEARQLANAAGELIANQREMERMRARLREANLAVSLRKLADGTASALDVADAVTSGSDRIVDAATLTTSDADLGKLVAALERLVAQSEQAHEATILEHTTKYPLLASYRRNHADRVDVDIAGLEQLQDGGRAGEIYARIKPVLDNTRKTQQALDNGELNVWKEDRVVQVTMAAQAIAPSSLHARIVQDRTARESEGSWTDWAIMAVTFALAIVAAIPTGGSSVVAAVVVTAEVSGALLDVYLVADHLRDYEIDKAKAGTNLDKAKAISADEPSLFWLGVDIIATGIGLGLASKTFKEVARDLRRAKAAAKLGIAESDIAVANVYRVSREGRLSADGAARAEQEIRAGSETLGATVHDARVRVTSDRIAELEQRLGIPVELDETGALGTKIELHYEKAANGDLTPTVLKVGANALVDDILAHADVVRRITRYNGLLGKLRSLWDRVFAFGKGRNPFPRGASNAYESFEELRKLDDLIALRRSTRMGTDIVDPAILDAEIEWLESFRRHHEAVVEDAMKSGKYGSALGHIDSPSRWRKEALEDAEKIVADKKLPGSHIGEYMDKRTSDPGGALADLRKVNTADELEALLQKTLGRSVSARPTLLGVADVDAVANELRASGLLSGDMGIFEKVIADAKRGKPGSLGELEAIRRWTREGKTVEILPEHQNAGRRNPDYRVNGKVTEIKSRSEALDDRWIKDHIKDASNQIKKSGLGEIGTAELQLRGDQATAVTLQHAERQVRGNFNEARGRNLDRVAIYKDGVLFAEWHRDAHGVVIRTFPL